MAKSQPIKWHGYDLYWIPWHPGYAVSRDGQVWSCWRATGRPEYKQRISSWWKTLKPLCRPEDGRKRYTIKCHDGRYRRTYGSRLVLETFVGPCPPECEVCHNDGDCTNDAIENLRWDTSAGNKADMRRHGTQVCGENHPKAKLADKDIPVILMRRQKGERLKSIADSYDVSEQRVHQICKKGTR